MTSSDKKRVFSKTRTEYLLRLTAVVLLAFVAALFFRRSAGIAAMTPIALLCCAAASFIPSEAKTYIAVFGITVFSVNTAEQEDISVTLMFTSLCIVFCVLFSFAAKRMKRSKKSGCAFFAGATAVSVILGLIFIGNPFSAHGAAEKIFEYTESTYGKCEGSALGEFVFSDIYYDFASRQYQVEVYCTSFPTEKRAVYMNGKTVCDNFKDTAREKLCAPYVSEMTSVLRNYFPDDTFSVTAEKISHLPNENIFSSDKDGLCGNITFEITLGGVQTMNDMREKISQYMLAVADSDIGYAGIVFKSGKGPWMRRYAYVASESAFEIAFPSILSVPSGASERFTEFFIRMTSPR